MHARKEECLAARVLRVGRCKPVEGSGIDGFGPERWPEHPLIGKMQGLRLRLMQRHLKGEAGLLRRRTDRQHAAMRLRDLGGDV